ncbi:MAG: helix-turn-helix domain-containing protein [Actinomycetaceae bacterium]|nr:helix-turn-helix domain-containing protein [Actinomycetaceae bacterium]
MRIAVHVFEGISLFHLASPLLVFGEVTRLGLASGWATFLWSDDGGAVHTAEDIGLTEVAGPERAAAEADMLVVPSWPPDLPEPAGALTAAMGAVHDRGGCVVGLCLGAFPVAASGLLDGRGATTHWMHADALARRYPAVEVRPGDLYVDSGHVLTSAGTASALDACLHLVRGRLGAEAAATIARRAVLAPHREGNRAQYVERPVAEHEHDTVGRVADWALANLDGELSVPALAARAHMSVRTFARRFAESTGQTPARWVLARRLDEARRLLETTAWSIDKVARSCGFGSAVTMRQNFSARYGTTPTSYRARFTR